MALTKVINSESKQYKPVLVDKLVLDAVPTVNSLNGVTSDAVARAIAGASGEVPQVTENDNGKVLKAVYDAGGPAVEWGEATVDQNYDATSTNAQSGVAVAQAIAAIPSEVSTASGHFDLEGSVPVKVNYTGTPHVVSDYITLTNPTTTTIGISLGIVFSTQGNKSLGSDTANLVISDTIHANFGGIYYAMNPPSPGPSITTSTVSITSGTIEAQTIVLSGSNPAESFGIGNDVIMLFSNLTDGETAESIMTKVSIQHWPAQTVDGYETTIPVVDQNYHSESANAQSGVAVAQAIAGISVDEVPDVTSTDNGKVLTASYSGGQGSYSWQTAQGGGGGGGASYTADAPIAIESDVIKLKYDGNFTTAYQFDASAITGYEQTNSYGMCSALTFTTLSPYYAGGKFCLIFDTKVIPNYYYVSISGQGMSDSTGWTIIAYKQGRETTDYAYATEVYDYDAAASSSSNKVIVGHGQDVKYFTFTFNQNNVHGDLSHTPLCFAIVPNPADSISGSSPWGTPYFQATGSLSNYLTQVVKTNTNPNAQNIPTGTGTIVADTLTLSSVVRTLPEYSPSDVNKVLKVNASGKTEWKYDDDTTYRAGNMISIDANYYNYIGVSTTAGITDIQQVNSLPASPVSTVLYLIPET